MKIVVADDDPVSRLLIEKTLVRSGYEVTGVANGRAAVEELRRPDGPRFGAS